MGESDMQEKLQILREDIKAQQPFAYWLHGATVPGVGNAGKEKLVSLFGTPQAVFRAKEAEFQTILTKEQTAALFFAKRTDVFAAYERLEALGISFYPFYHPAYPGRLYRIPDRPFGIYVKGKLPKVERKSIAIIGARDCSAYGRYAAEWFASELAKNKIAVISGMARGIDGIAQEAALQAGGESYGVLGCSVEICYPSSHAALYGGLCERGGVLSEYPPGTKPLPGRFPPRNRIISGLSDALLVIEARKKSGTLITVDMALEQGKEVCVVPGRITDRLSDGCNELLKQGAVAALSPKQLFKELSETVWSGQISMGGADFGGSAVDGAASGTGVEKSAVGGLSAQEKELLSLLDFYPVTLDQIRMVMQTKEKLCGLTLPQTMEMLVMLTLKGQIKNENGYYVLCAPM